MLLICLIIGTLLMVNLTNNVTNFLGSSVDTNKRLERIERKIDDLQFKQVKALDKLYNP